MSDPRGLFVGVISDTHGLMRPAALQALAGAAHILHAGDVGAPAVIEALRALAPVTVVRGNNDHAPWAAPLPETASVELGGARVFVVHELAHLAFDPRAAGVAVVVTGHSHKPVVAEREGVLYLNPGSAGPRRFKLPVTVAHLRIDAGRPTATIVRLPE